MWGALLSSVAGKAATGAVAGAKTASTLSRIGSTIGTVARIGQQLKRGTADQSGGQRPGLLQGDDPLMQYALERSQQSTGLPKSLMEMYLEAKANLANNKLSSYRR